MRYLLENLEIFKVLLSSRQIALFLDYDGTLTPIVDKPGAAVLSSQTRKVLEQLTQNEHFRVFIISGRSMADVKNLIGVSKIVYVGNHGMEIEGDEIDFGGFSFLRFREILEDFKKKIAKELVFFKGAFVEDKGLGLSVHYRLLDAKSESAFKKLLKRYTEDLFSKKEARITSGKKVLEIRPPIDWDKGKALLWILSRPHFFGAQREVLPVYIGDDTTDEDAFLAIKDTGISVYVGNQKSSHAQYFLNNTEEVVKFLEHLLEVKTHEKSGEF